MSSTFSGDETAPFFGFLGAAAALVFSCVRSLVQLTHSGRLYYIPYINKQPGPFVSPFFIFSHTTFNPFPSALSETLIAYNIIRSSPSILHVVQDLN
uniref:Uncharacterized protein n=1 Tax=Helianthus annuus TaxID=4232 RepID=A0A251RQ06_HELAN